MSVSMKASFSFVAWLGLISPSLDANAADPAWKLVWSDEFAGKKLDYSKWGVEVNAFGGGNNEMQLFTDRTENIRVENGHLVIEARKDRPNIQGTVREYSSGRVRTKHRGDWKYGRIEVRAKLPEGKGLWPAIWMLPTEDKYGPWAASGEIDIMELVGHEPNKVLGTLHFGDVWPKNQHAGSSYQLPQGTFAEDFHVFAIEWEQGEIRWYVDDKLTQTQNQWNSKSAAFPAPFDQAFHLVLNVSVGGNLPGPPNATTKFPQQMRVDYVRVYQKK